MPIFDSAIFDGISPPSFMFDTGPSGPVVGLKAVQQAQVHGTQSSGALHGKAGSGSLHDKLSSARVAN